MANRLDSTMRKEIANEVWRVFGLIFKRISLSFTEDSITVIVNLKEPVDLDGPIFITALCEGYNQYFELPVGERHP
jgi:hypothetical protein